MQGYYACKGKDTELEQHVICVSVLCIYGQKEFYLNDTEIDLNTLCQYTGLEDKNGVKIFEGDLLKGLFYGFPLPENYEFRVYWDDKTSGFQSNYFEPKKCEVIGNIHDKEKKYE